MLQRRQCISILTIETEPETLTQSLAYANFICANGSKIRTAYQMTNKF